MAIPEFVQNGLTPAALAEAASKLLYDPKAAQDQLNAQALALDKMGRHDPPAAERAADALLKLLDAS
jgi:lipid A disaccharide synthetase